MSVIPLCEHRTHLGKQLGRNIWSGPSGYGVVYDKAYGDTDQELVRAVKHRNCFHLHYGHFPYLFVILYIKLLSIFFKVAEIHSS